MKKALAPIFIFGLIFTLSVGTTHAATLKDLYNRINNLFETVNGSQQALPASTAYILDSQVDAVNTTIADIKKTQPTVSNGVALGVVLDGPVYRSAKPETIKKLQTVLKQNGYFKDEATGKYGALTTAAVKAFQKDNMIDTNGNAGPKTVAKLNEISKLVNICADGTQNIIVTPRVGETYKASDKVAFRWISCTAGSTAPVDITVKNETTGATAVVASGIANDGSETVSVGSKVGAGTYRAMVTPTTQAAGQWSVPFTLAK